MSALIECLSAEPLHRCMGRRVAEFAGKSCAERFRIDLAARHFQVASHACGIYMQAADDMVRLRDGSCAEHHDLWQGFPFRLPSAEPPLMLLRHRREHRGYESRNACR